MAGARRIDSNSQSIGEFLRRPVSYCVPSYQRNFAWKSDQIDVLWEDITTSLEEGRPQYFLGAIVISPTDSKVMEVIDGQQRLGAISMILAVIARKWTSLGDERRATGVFRDYLGSEDRRTGDVIQKLSLNETNNAAFRSLVLRGETVSTTERRQMAYSNRLLAEAVQRITAHLDAWLQGFDDAETALLDLEDFVADSTNLIVIEAGDDSDAFVIFETLNDRGLDLAPPDLVKNYLFSLAESHIERFKRVWAEISVLVGSENLTQFLRHYWLSEYALVRERGLYRAIRNSTRTTTKARRLIERLRRTADLYAALTNPQHSYWADFPPEVRNYLEALLLFKVTQFRPVALAAMEKLPPQIIPRLLRMLMVISFRYTVISSLGTGNLERIYTDAALAIRMGRVTGLSQVFSHLRSAYVDDSRFLIDFEQKKLTKPAVARYILAELNDHLQQDPERMVAESTGRVTLEHILPKNPGEEWRGAFAAQHDPSDYVDLVGNLTLLEKGRNRGIANAGFLEKRDKAFADSSLILNQELATMDDWTFEDILQRSKHLAEIAGQLWRLDY